MDDFSTPNTVNFFGIPASPANYIEPGKRPTSSMAPLIIFDKNNQRVLQVLGASGGTKITTSTAQVSMLNLWFQKDIKQAIDAPRLHSQLLPEEVLAERGFDQVESNLMLNSILNFFNDRQFYNNLEIVVIIFNVVYMEDPLFKVSNGENKKINCGLVVMYEKVERQLDYKV